MKCRAMQKKWLTAMLAAGMVLLAGGLIWAYGVGAADGLPMRMAGFLSGLGGALAAIGGGCLLLNRIRGERRTRESALHMEDERGLAVAYKAQNAAAIAETRTKGRHPRAIAACEGSATAKNHARKTIPFFVHWFTRIARSHMPMRALTSASPSG